MANIEILSAELTLRWHQQLVKAGCSDVYFFPEYAQTFISIEEGKSHLFIYEEGDSKFLYPFRLRKLSLIKQFAEFSDWSDITSEYGYGGPIVSVPKENKVESFIKNSIQAFDEFCTENRVVSEFCRFHPLLENAQYMKKGEYKPIFCNQTVWVDLTLEEDECWRQMRENHRRDIRKAEKYGVEIEISDSLDNIDLFYELYIQTMQSVGANRYYFFNKKFFGDTLQFLAGHSSVFLARYQGKTIAAVLYIWGNNFLHYHFGGMDRKFTHIRANKILHYNAIMWGKKKGFKKLHLGGGVGGFDKDSLMLFKAGFSKLRADFYIAKRIHNHDIYHKLCAMVNIDPDTDSFFPAYRVINRR